MTTVPVIELTHLTEAQKRAYVIADNRLALDAGWDEDLLAEELKALEGLDFNLELTGFDLDELHDLLEDESAEEVPAPEPPDDPVSQPGDLWVLGNHRLLCGDSSDPAALDRLLAGAEIHLVNTDPPYNVKVEPRSQQRDRRRPVELPSAKSASRLDAHGMHHQGSTSRGTPTKSKADREDARQGPSAGQRLRLRRGVRRDARGLVREHRPRAAARARRSTSGAATPTAPTTRRC